MPAKNYANPASARYRALLATIDAWRTQGVEVTRYRLWSDMNDTMTISKPVVYSMVKTLLRDGLLGEDALGLYLLPPARRWLTIVSPPLPPPPPPKPTDPPILEALEAAIRAANELGVLLELSPTSKKHKDALFTLESEGRVAKCPYDTFLGTNAGYVCKGSALANGLLRRLDKRPTTSTSEYLDYVLRRMQ